MQASNEKEYLELSQRVLSDVEVRAHSRRVGKTMFLINAGYDESPLVVHAPRPLRTKTSKTEREKRFKVRKKQSR